MRLFEQVSISRFLQSIKEMKRRTFDHLGIIKTERMGFPPFENLDITDDYIDLPDGNGDMPDERTDLFNDLSDEENVDEYDTYEDFSDISYDV